MNKKFDISNVNYELTNSSLPRFKEVQVTFTHNGKVERYIVFLEDKGKKNYIREAKKIFKRDLNEGKVVKTLKAVHKGGVNSPLLVTSVSILGVAAITFASLFTWRMLTSLAVNTYKITFSCPNCKIFDEFNNEITAPIDITVPSGYTTYRKFYLKGDNLHHNPLKSSIFLKKEKEFITNYFYEPITGEFTIPIIGNLNITAQGINKTLEECTWSEIKEISTTGRADEFFDIGNTKKVQLKHQDLNNDGEIDDNEVYQTVRIIGLNEDYTELPTDGSDPDPNKVIGITFEFADLISDVNGYSLATYWKNTNSTTIANHDYKDSSIRQALTKEGEGDLHWFEKEGTEYSVDPKYANKSVLDMLPDELSDVLATTSKYINIYENGDWDEQTVEDKLFLLSSKEMGNTYQTDYEEEHTTAYSYYKNATLSDKIKRQIKGLDGAITNFTEVISGEYSTNPKRSYAGYNFTYNDAGAYLWFRSPYTDDNNNSAWYVGHDGYAGSWLVCYYALGVAPAFCI